MFFVRNFKVSIGIFALKIAFLLVPQNFTFIKKNLTDLTFSFQYALKCA